MWEFLNDPNKQLKSGQNPNTSYVDHILECPAGCRYLFSILLLKNKPIIGNISLSHF